MKNILITVAVLSITAFIGSCKKTSQQFARNSFEQQNDGASVEQSKFIAGSWETARWQSFDEGSRFLRGKIFIDTDRSNNENDVKLVFVRFRGREEYIYQSLPTMLPMSGGDVEMKYDIMWRTLSIWVIPGLNSNLPDLTEVSSFEYRYIIVPADIFSGMMIDWSDYNIVAEALNI